MNKKGWILLLILLCVAFLVSCGKKESADRENGELVRTEAEGRTPFGFFLCQNDQCSFLT